MKKISLIMLAIAIVIVVAIYKFGFLRSDIKNISDPQNIDQGSVTASISDATNKTSLFTLDDVSRHSAPNDCYLVINSKVYDVSSFIENHPGGMDKIISNCGKEVSGIFAQIHSNKAWDLLAKYSIGNIQ